MSKVSQPLPKLTEKDVYNQLKEVIDPEIQADIVSIGLIYQVKVSPKKDDPESWQVYIQMTLTTPGCPLIDVIEDNIRKQLDQLEGLNGYKDVEIDLTFDPPWTMDMMSDEVKAELGF